MSAIKDLTELDFSYLFISVFVILTGLKSALSVMEWAIDRLGLETRQMKRRRKEQELLSRTSHNLAALKEYFTDSIRSVSEREAERGKQIEALMRGSKELLGAEIDKRYREYISLGGIPESETDEFEDIFSAYKHLNGNHKRDAKYDYVKDHLHVIPVETKLITEKEGETE